MNIKTINSTKLRQNLAQILNTLDKNTDLIISRKNKQKYALIDLDRYEDLLANSNPQYLKEIVEAREQAQRGETLTFDEVLDNL